VIHPYTSSTPNMWSGGSPPEAWNEHEEDGTLGPVASTGTVSRNSRNQTWESCTVQFPSAEQVYFVGEESEESEEAQQSLRKAQGQLEVLNAQAQWHQAKEWQLTLGWQAAWAEVQRLQSEQKVLEADISTLTEMLAEAQEKNQTFEDLFQESDEENQKLQRRVKFLETKVLKRLQDSLKAKDVETSKLLADLQASQAAAAAVSSREEARCQVEALQKEVQLAKETTQKELAETEAKHQAALKEMKRLKGGSDVLLEEVARLTKTCCSLRVDAAKATLVEKEKAVLEEQLAKATMAQAEAVKRIESSELLEKELQETLKQREAELNNKMETLAKLQERNRSLQVAAAEAAEKEQEAKGQLLAAQEKLALETSTALTAQGALAEAQRAKDQAMEENLKAQELQRMAEAKCKEAIAQQLDAQDQCTQVQQAFAAVEQRELRAKAELISQSQEAHRLTEKCVSLSHEKAELEQKLQQKLVTHEQVEQSLMAKQAELQVTQDALKTLQVPCHILLAVVEAARVIGKGGASIKAIREQSGANLRVLQEELPHEMQRRKKRVAVITGEAHQVQEAISGVLERVFAHLPATAGRSLRNRDYILEVLVPEKSGSHLIGQQGERVQALCQETKCDIIVGQVRVSPLAGTKEVRISGSSASDVAGAIWRLMEVLGELVRGGSLRPEQFTFGV